MNGSTSKNELGRVQRLRRRLAQFRHEENGGAIIFTLFLITMMLILSGYAIDTMRFENKRARLQATLDRAVLAAADLDQTMDCQAVVRNYFEAADLLDQVTSVNCVESLNGRTVSATAALDVQTMFMQGVDTLIAPASGAATESVSDVEIVLVLDISGSMRSNNKITNLISAAREFVQTIRANDVENRISVAIVPFNAQVNLGPTLYNAYLGITDEHGITNSNCIDLPALSNAESNAVFASPGISPAISAPQAGYFDATSTTTTTMNWVSLQAPVLSTASTPQDASPTCKVFANNIVRLPAQNVTTMRSQIAGLTGDGNTSITLGMKWGTAMLDPTSRPLFTSFIAAGLMPATLAGRPYDYTREDTLKVIVLMTDGEHVSSTFLNSGYRVGPAMAPIPNPACVGISSTIYRAASDNNFSVRFPCGRPASAGANEYWVPHRSEWRASPWSGNVNGVGVVNQPTWPQVWSAARMQWVARQLYARALGGTTQSAQTTYFNAQMTRFRGQTDVNTMNSQLQASCAQARARGVVVFGIAFEAPANGQTQIAGCSSSPSHYYNAAGLDIVTAFRSIASQINALRLIQ